MHSQGVKARQGEGTRWKGVVQLCSEGRTQGGHGGGTAGGRGSGAGALLRGGRISRYRPSSSWWPVVNSW